VVRRRISLINSQPVFSRVAILAGFVTVSLAAQTDSKAPHPIDGQMIIWSGERTQAEADKEAEAFKRYAQALKDFVEVTPVVVESASVEGLKSGFFVVALGVCDEKASRKFLKLFQTIEPAVYARQVHYKAENAAEAPDCPTFVDVPRAGNDEPVYWELGDPVRAPEGGGALVALPFSYDWSEQGDFAREYFEVRVEVLLIAANRALLDFQQYASPSDAAKLKSASSTGNSIAWELDYADPPCSPSGDRLVAWKRSFTALARAGKIELIKGTARRTDSGKCGYAEEGEMIQGKKKPH
jgi:hypothetical protein